MASSNTTTVNGGTRPAHLEPSKLGTKEYWDSLYTTELTNHAADPADIGTVWFDDSDAEAKIVEFLGRLSGDESDTDSENDHEDGDGQQGNAKNKGQPLLSRSETSFLDLGCGNGSLLFALRDDGWSGPTLGVDYSAQSIALAQQVASSRASTHVSSSSSPNEPPTTASTSTLSFLQWDVIAGPYNTILSGSQSSGFDAVLDKGTFDAISLSDEKDHRGRRLCELYRGRVMRLLKNGGLFLVTSCNWTEEELRGWFEGERQDDDDDGDEANGRNGGAGGGRFVVADRVNYRTFSFGGVKGQTISTLCFRKES